MSSSVNPGEAIRDRLARRGARPCSVDGCLLPCHQLSQFCRRCAHRAERHGSPTQRAIRVYELKFYRKTVDRFLAANVGHPALIAVCADLSKLLSDAAALPVVHRPRSRDWKTRLRLDLQRLYKAGLTGTEVFRLVASLHLFAVSQSGSLAPMSKSFWFQAARLILNSRDRHPSDLFNRSLGARLPAPTLEHLGRTVMVMLHRVLSAMVESLERASKAPEERRARIEAALAAQPFAPPSTLQEPTNV
jgi:hypothetical protein